MKKVSVIFMVALVLACCIFIILEESKRGNKIELLDKDNMMAINEFNIDERATLKKENVIYVGNNIKELENGFYDIKIENADNSINIYLNKLWYKNYGNDYIQDDYLARICRKLRDKLNVESNTESFEYILYKYIKDNYVNVRKNKSIEPIITDKLNLELEQEDNIVKLIIRGN